MSSFKLLQYPYIRAVLISNVFSQVGIWMRNFAVLLFVVEQTGGNARLVSLISVAEYGPVFLFSFLGGVFADRYQPRRTLLWCDFASAASVFAILAMLWAGAWEAVFFTTLVSSILSQFSQPSGMKLFKRHVSEELTASAMSLFQTVSAVFMVLGPMLGTFVYQTWGISSAVALTGAAFLLSAFSLLRIPADAPENAQVREIKSSLLQEMREGIKYVVNRKELTLLSLCFLAVGLGVGVISPLGIFVVTERLGLPATEMKWLSMTYGAGEIIGGIATFALAGKTTPQKLLLLGLLVNAAGIMLTGLSGALWLTLLAQCLIALLQPAIFIGNNALTMKHTDVEYIGRVTGFRTPLMTGAMLLMMALSGMLKTRLSLEWVYMLGGMSLLAGLAAVIPLFRENKGTSGAK